jgi:hypothetical protein
MMYTIWAIQMGQRPFRAKNSEEQVPMSLAAELPSGVERM